MLAAYAAEINPDDPLAGLVVGERPAPEPPEGWVLVDVRAAALNHHDVWSLRGVGLGGDKLPMILGCDAAGVDQDGNEVLVHSVISSPGWTGEQTLDPRRSLLSERHQGTLAEQVIVPAGNLVPKPAGLSFEEAACLPTAFLTAYKMLCVNGGPPGSTVLVQGVGGGVATAAIGIGAATGYRVWATSRDEGRRQRALELGADAVFAPGERLPERVDVVLETVGAATWSHSVSSLKPGGTLVIAGATSGDAPSKAELTRIFFHQLRVQGSTMGNREQLVAVTRLLEQTGLRPVIDRVIPLADAASGIAALAAGEVFGKVVLTP
ncbi:zinc-binding dehydrogenase [Ornithinimicrobium faecis]|uniref:Zinc-binding dehydrogenase n=1 Tax=Ornithinimicrobium faecis TaxID=2934158 RepID=A0ABY4YS09_9MICO|nr:zinc-binding dehydrogenase [Ornithinimicrobium sp. HY1793]USQ79371.1 zinc-binding dehydrogenase [Ornithinimicrobium sp. HY1793]